MRSRLKSPSVPAEPSSLPLSAPRSADRLPVLDALRGLAICMVLAVHFTPDYLMGNHALEWAKKLLFAGWAGVDLFFILSGFLITDILLRVRQTPGWVRNFYLRRALRILPLYLGSLVIVFGVLPWLIPTGSDPRFDALQSFQGWYWAHCANVAVLLHGFGSTASDTVDLGHLWSLAVEEHFYLVWPFVVARVSERRLAPVLLAIVGVAIAFRLLALASLPHEMLSGACVQTPTRMDGLALGALLTLLFRRIPMPALRRGATVAIAISGLALATDFLLEKGLWVGSVFIRSVGFTLLGVFFASLLVLLVTDAPNALARRLIDNPVLRFFGKYSYGLYLIHVYISPALERWLPKEALLAQFHTPLLAMVVCLVVKTSIATALALLSWHLLEAPCLRLKHRFDYRRPSPSA